MPTLTGEVQRITYENEETGFRVLKVLPEGAKGLALPVVGVFGPVGVGAKVRASGDYVEDAKHGRQFRTTALVVLSPETLEGLERYLGSGVIEGLGPGFAKRLVATFGLDTLRVLDEDPERLARVPGLKGERLKRIRAAWAAQRRLSNVRILLQNNGISPGLANRILHKYDDRAAQVVERHPYRLALEVSGVGFKTADKIAQAQGVGADHPERVQAGVVHSLRTLADSGHACCPRAVLVTTSAALLGVGEPHVEAGVDALWAAGRVCIEHGDVYLPHLHEAEVGVSQELFRLLAAGGKTIPRWAEQCAAFEREAGYPLSPEQQQSLEQVSRHPCVVITGGPGVGKTTLVRAILQVFRGAGLTVQLCAPTGRAAKRLSESTGASAATLHRLLEFEPRAGTFRRGAAQPLECGAVIVDEASMLDIELAHALLRAIGSDTRLVIVGDVDQLASVGPGAFLHDVIQSGRVVTARLSRVFRQAEASSIVRSAHEILAGQVPVGDPPGGSHAEFFVIERRHADQAASLIVELVTQRIPARFGVDARNDIQVLCPMRRGPAGTLALGQALQAELGRKDEQEGPAFTAGLRMGDKVMQVRNDYDKDVFNGDVGRVVLIDEEQSALTVEFDGRRVCYTGRDVDSLMLAYAITVHKSQGSEYPVVVMPLLTAHFPMLSRNLLYTAITRAKRVCVLIADPRALRLAVGERLREDRYTRLADRLRALPTPARQSH